LSKLPTTLSTQKFNIEESISVEEEEKVSFEESILKFAEVRMLYIYLNKVFFSFLSFCNKY